MLLVNDKPKVLDALARSLHGEHCVVLTAVSATEALDVLAVYWIDVVILDCDMPSMNGPDFLLEVEKKYPGTIRFMLVDEREREFACAAVNNGAIDRFFLVPSGGAELGAAIRDALILKRGDEDPNER